MYKYNLLIKLHAVDEKTVLKMLEDVHLVNGSFESTAVYTNDSWIEIKDSSQPVIEADAQFCGHCYCNLKKSNVGCEEVNCPDRTAKCSCEHPPDKCSFMEDGNCRLKERYY